MLRCLVIAGLITCPFCGQEDRVESPDVRAKWDNPNFEIPADVAAAAPHMQDHLLQLLRFDSQLFEVKPVFVFLDGNREFQGPPNVLVTSLTFLHLAYYRGSQLVWSGSVIFDSTRGVGLNAQAGYQIDIVPGSDDFRLSFDVAGVRLIGNLPKEKTKAIWLERGPHRLYAHHYLLPHSIPKP